MKHARAEELPEYLCKLVRSLYTCIRAEEMRRTAASIIASSQGNQQRPARKSHNKPPWQQDCLRYKYHRGLPQVSTEPSVPQFNFTNLKSISKVPPQSPSHLYRAISRTVQFHEQPQVDFEAAPESSRSPLIHPFLCYNEVLSGSCGGPAFRPCSGQFLCCHLGGPNYPAAARLDRARQLLLGSRQSYQLP